MKQSVISLILLALLAACGVSSQTGQAIRPLIDPARPTLLFFFTEN